MMINSLKFIRPGETRKLRLPILGACALSVLAACGGGTSSSPVEAESESSRAQASDLSTTAIHGTAVAEPKLLVAGSGGFVANALGRTRVAGTQSDFDILVVGDSDKIDATTKAQVNSALKSGKQVVFDGPSDGSNRAVHNQILMEVTGMSLGAAAVLVQKEPNGDGYYVTPIDRDTASPEASGSATAAAAGTQRASNNTVASIFDTSGSDK